ncbi:MAG: protein SCO1/2 [Flavobacteriales bacterium]|jgi:protein SCO1/2
MKSAIAFLIILFIGIGAATYVLSDKPRTLPFINPVDVNPDMVDESLQNQGRNHLITDFYLQNQDGEWVDQKIIADKIVVANYFFTTCPSICPMMNKEVMRINEHFKESKNVMILSHTVWPEVDSVELMKEYEGRYQADASTWQFLTGDKKHLYELARKSYLIAPDVNDPNYEHGSENDFIHTETLVLIDKNKRIRGMYDGTSEKEVNQLIEDIELLLEK